MFPAPLPFVLAAWAAPALAEEVEPDPWDLAAPPLPLRQIPIDVREGTWMSLDVSPDGTTIAFDLLGDLYTLPIDGGEAVPVAAGFPWEIQPRFSPDGEHIAFRSDRDGADNLWVMDADGSNKRQVSKETFQLLGQPTWKPDGSALVGRKHFTTSRSLGTGELWLYHLGGGAGVPLVKRPNEEYQKELGEPAFAPRSATGGDAIYYTQSSTGGDTFTYADDSNGELFVIKRYDLATGRIETVVSGAGGAVAPTPSPDGRTLAFVRRDRTDSQLYVQDLASGAVRKVHDLVDQDLQEVWGVHGLYPTFDWMPDSRSVVVWDGGKIRRIDVSTGVAAEIPFHVADTRAIVDPPRPAVAVAPDTFQTTMPRFATVSPDGRRVVFESLGKLWVKDVAGGAPQRLTRDRSARREVDPAWSRDGKDVAFVAWTDAGLGSVRAVRASGGSERALTTEPGHYAHPAWAPDGTFVVFEKGRGGGLVAPEWSAGAGVYSVPARGGAATRITGDGSAPQFAATSDRIFLTVFEDDALKLVSVDRMGGERRVHASGGMVQRYAVSPTGEHLVFHENYDAWLMPLTPGPQALDATKGGGGLPVVELSGDGATWGHFSGDGRTVWWTLGPTLYSAAVADALPSWPASDDEEVEPFEPPTTGLSLSMTVPAAKPNGTVALVGAKLVTMAGEGGGVVEDGVIVVRGDRIEAVGPRGAVSIPAGAAVIDLGGKVVTPGFIDAHAHGQQAAGELIPQQNWSLHAHLAFGVTTLFDPSNAASEILPASEYQRAGAILGPRLFSTAEVVYGAKAPGFYAEIGSYEDALAHVRRLKQQGAHGIKNYNQPRRIERVWVAEAARATGLIVVAEGGSLFHMDLAMVTDGNTGIEHNLPQSNLYEDVLQLFGQSQVGYTPTLGVTYGGLGADPYWRMVDDVWTHPILSRHVPPEILVPRNVRRKKAPEGDFYAAVSARTAGALADRGVLVSIGAHGQEWGLAAHWEMWSFVSGGMSPLEALERATVDPARHLGFAADLGTIEPGKLADLVVLDADPLADIRNTDDIRYVMLGGRLYEAATLNEVTTGSSKRAPYYWER